MPTFGGTSSNVNRPLPETTQAYNPQNQSNQQQYNQYPKQYNNNNNQGYNGNSRYNRLRSKIEADPRDPRCIVTVWGVGYRFDPPAAGA